jgi:L-amino acid N-acyltransferase YncA
MKPKNEIIKIRLATEDDFEIIFSIWLEGIANSFKFDETDKVKIKEKFTFNFTQRQGIFNFWVAIDSEKTILGWQSLINTLSHPFKNETFAESSTYISKNNRFEGVGKLLLGYAISEAKKSELEYILGFVSMDNEPAKQICKETGWTEIGVLPQGRKYNVGKQKLILVRTL